jgi:hypothetical protein
VVPPLTNSIDISAYDILDIQFLVSQQTPSVVNYYILTSMQNDVDDVSGINLQPSTQTVSWPVAMNITATSPTLPYYKPLTQSLGLFRYIRWGVMATTGSGAVTFSIRGMARRYGNP